jgi:ribosomal protein S1
VRDVGPLMGLPQPFQILKMDRRRGNIVVSRRAILEETRAEQRTELVGQNLEEGQSSKASSRTSPTTVRSSTWAASTACCTSPT